MNSTNHEMQAELRPVDDTLLTDIGKLKPSKLLHLPRTRKSFLSHRNPFAGPPYTVARRRGVRGDCQASVYLPTGHKVSSAFAHQHKSRSQSQEAARCHRFAFYVPITKSVARLKMHRNDCRTARSASHAAARSNVHLIGMNFISAR